MTPLTWQHFTVWPPAVAHPKAHPKYAERGGQNGGFEQKRICVRNRHRGHEFLYSPRITLPLGYFKLQLPDHPPEFVARILLIFCEEVGKGFL